jgi:hypothetical protein
MFYGRRSMDTTMSCLDSGPSRRAGTLLASVVAAIALLVAIAAGPTPKADAAPQPGNNYFCQMQWLSPFGKSGDRCFAGRDLWGHNISIWVTTYQRAGCVNYAGYYYELYANWNCTGSYSETGITLPWDGGSYQGVIRNNNLNYSGNFSGRSYCCYPYN